MSDSDQFNKLDKEINAETLREYTKSYNMRQLLEDNKVVLNGIINAAKSGRAFYEIPEDRPELSRKFIEFLKERGLGFWCSFYSTNDFRPTCDPSEIFSADRIRIYW